LRDGIGIIDDAAETGPLAASVPDSGGVYVVPAFAGLGSPWWDPYARGTIIGITRGTTRAHITRAVVESMAYQTRDVVDAMVAASGTPIVDLRVDGGASVMDLMLQMQADQLGVTVHRPADQETTALGAAFLAGLELDEYQSHSIYISRYPYGREATMSFPAPDLRISNPTPYSVLIWTSYEDTSITVQMYSTPYFETEQSGQRSYKIGACTRVDTYRTRTAPDRTVTEDSVFATYRPGEGLDCNGNRTARP